MGPAAREQIAKLQASKIRLVANAAMGRDDVLPFWFGESDQPTPDFITEAAVTALRAHRSFYTHTMGSPWLRESISAYLRRLHGRAFDPAAIAVTSAGVSALMVAMQAILDPGDHVVAVTPVWPNLLEIPKILSAEITEVALRPTQQGWRLDVDELFAAVTARTRLLLVNSPSNPTGWVLDAASRDAILTHCRALGIWVIGDDVYERLVFDPALPSAPSFLAAAQAGDRVISVNSFSKAWRMTGWRLGWIAAPVELAGELAKLLEFNTSCAPEFVQAGAKVALDEGEAEVARLRAGLVSARNRLIGALQDMPGVQTVTPDGGMYAFFRIEGASDSVALCRQLIDEAGLGLAPGGAFGEAGEGWLRWCFAARPARLEDGIARLSRWMQARQGSRAARLARP